MQFKDTYVEQIANELESEVVVFRIITPLAFGLMTRFDVVIVTEKRAIEVINQMFYQRGDKESEKKALEGDRA